MSGLSGGACAARSRSRSSPSTAHAGLLFAGPSRPCTHQYPCCLLTGCRLFRQTPRRSWGPTESPGLVRLGSADPSSAGIRRPSVSALPDSPQATQVESPMGRRSRTNDLGMLAAVRRRADDVVHLSLAAVARRQRVHWIQASRRLPRIARVSNSALGWLPRTRSAGLCPTFSLFASGRARS